MNYKEFIESKVEIAPKSGFIIDDSEISPCLKPHQRDTVKWCIEGGRRGIFQRFGLGKTIQELEICRLIIKHKGGNALIVLPLGVKQEFTNDAQNLLNIEPPKYITKMSEAAEFENSILMTNYERVRDGDIDPKQFTCCVLDEAAVLRSFGSKTYQTFIDKFKGVRYKFVATATPSPNRYKELIHYAGFLEVMDTGQALTRFFQRDSTKANNLRLYPHREKEFWAWVGTWGLFISKPSDLGYDDAGYDLPPLKVNTHIISADFSDLPQAKDGQFEFLREAATSLSDAAKEKSRSIQKRVAKAKEIIEASPDDSFILWHDLEAERHEIKRQIDGVVDIYGSMDYDEREKRVTDFAFGKIKLFATKKSLSGSGCNFQRYCHRAIFVGIDYEFNDFIQAIHRIYRFLQTKEVIIDIIYTEAEEPIYQTLMEKWKLHDELAANMREVIRKYGLSATAQSIKRAKGVERMVVEGQNYKAILNDCVEETAKMKENSVDLICTSIPFSNHYEYSPNYNDFGHNADTAKFFEQMDFLSPNLLKILRPGRVFACHVKDRIMFGNVTGTGMSTVEPFHAMCINHYMKHGFEYFGMITVCTDVVRENNQTYRLGWTEQCKDGTKMGVGCPEYILLFRKLPTDTTNAYADEPVTKSKEDYTRAQWQLDAHGYWRSSGDRLLTKDEVKGMSFDILQKIYKQFSETNVYDYHQHVETAEALDNEGRLPASFMVVAPASWRFDIWDDINRMKTLNTSQSRRRQQLHVCPLQLDIIERIINRFSNVGDTVFDPFGGIMSVPYMAVKMKRYGMGCELNADYFRDGVGYLEEADSQAEMPTLFDFVGRDAV